MLSRQAIRQRLLKGLQYVPRVIMTDKRRSYGVAKRQLLPDVEHRQTPECESDCAPTAMLHAIGVGWAHPRPR